MALEIDPKMAVAYNNRGNAYDDKGQYDRALADYNKALDLNPKYAEAYYNRGRAQLWKLPEKTSSYEKVLVYTSSLTPKLQPSEVMVLGSSPCRRMEDYCSPQGRQLFREEMAAAIDSLVKRLSLEMGL